MKIRVDHGDRGRGVGCAALQRARPEHLWRGVRGGCEGLVLQPLMGTKQLTGKRVSAGEPGEHVLTPD